ncbi:hypothetical protein AB0D27_26305 [Streptomyces sp. NPDC048415]|jgi:hypothetical protein|uniref:hypothetical protein n=1 Tax=Streptomyces sp. NPDC048415 TaxID=3154822 RepID=UPI003421D8A3
MTLCRSPGFEPGVRFESTDLLPHTRLIEQGHATAPASGDFGLNKKSDVLK